METSQTTVKKKYPDLTGLFAEKEKARIKRAKRPFAEKIATVTRLRDLTRTLKQLRPTIKKRKIVRP